MTAHEPKHVSLDKPADVEYWTRHWGVTREQLEEVIARVGNDREKVGAEIASAAAKLETGPPSDQISTSRSSKG